MADAFTFISSPESDDSSVENILSQAQDLLVLEQIAALSAASQSELPTHLETRFQKLKSFTEQRPKIPSPSSNPEKRSRSKSLPQCRKTPPSSLEPEKDSSEKPTILFEQEEQTKNSNQAVTTETEVSTQSSPSQTMDSLSPARSKDFKGSKPKSGSGSVFSPPIFSAQSSPDSSPPRQVCCFWCSPKKDSRRKNRFEKDGIMGLDFKDTDWGRNEEEFLSDLSTFSLKEQRRSLKKAKKEQEKVNREAEKVVEWVKQASARMDVSVVEDLDSDEENSK